MVLLLVPNWTLKNISTILLKKSILWTICSEKIKIYLSLFSARNLICLFPVNLDVLLWIINWRLIKGICSFSPLKYTNLRINLTQVSCGKHIRWKYPIFTEKWLFLLNSKRKHSEIWNKFIKFQRKWLVERPTNKFTFLQ